MEHLENTFKTITGRCKKGKIHGLIQDLNFKIIIYKLKYNSGDN